MPFYLVVPSASTLIIVIANLSVVNRVMVAQHVRCNKLCVAMLAFEEIVLARVLARHVRGQRLGCGVEIGALGALVALLRVHRVQVSLHAPAFGVAFVALRTGVRSFVGVLATVVYVELVRRDVGALADLYTHKKGARVGCYRSGEIQH